MIKNMMIQPIPLLTSVSAKVALLIGQLGSIDLLRYARLDPFLLLLEDEGNTGPIMFYVRPAINNSSSDPSGLPTR